MKIRSFIHVFCVVIVAIFSLTSVSFSQAQESRKRIAVLDFEFDAIQKWWTGDWNVGAGISEILVTKFFEEGTYELVDRNAIDLILKEQDFTQSSRFNPSHAAELGKLLGADALVIGSITQFGTEKKKSGGMGGFLGKKAGVLGGIGLKKTKAKCVINARLIDVNTGVIIAVAEGEGKSDRKGLLLGAVAAGQSSVAGGAVQMSSSGFRETILGEATNKACQDVVLKIAENSSKIIKAKLNIVGLVADYDVETNQVTITPGQEAGVAVGQSFKVLRVTGVIKHPTTGDIIREKTKDICLLEIIESGDGYAVAKMVGSGAPESGDKVQIVFSDGE